jgi:hypothetical protein
MDAQPFIRRHFRIGWTAILLFAVLGLSLETLHALKAGFYLDVGQETRRLLWRLAHAHGVLIGLLNLGFAATLHAGFGPGPTQRARASLALLAAQILLPLGFLAGGIWIHGGDPNLAVVITPFGALALLLGLALCARGTYRTGSSGGHGG